MGMLYWQAHILLREVKLQYIETGGAQMIAEVVRQY
jgi:hypothetical protein